MKSICCPQCGEQVPANYYQPNDRSGHVVWIAAPGSLIPCSKCGLNLADVIVGARYTRFPLWVAISIVLSSVGLLVFALVRFA